MKTNKFHKSFKFQGKSFSDVNELLLFSKISSIEVYNFIENWFDEKLYIEVKTSGSTGVPKIIQLQKKYMINSAKATGCFFELPENTRALLCMSPNYIAGKMMLVRALTLGWNIDIVEPTSNPLENIETAYDFSAMVPLQVANSLKDFHKIKKLIVGGGVVSNELLHQIQHINTEVFATYGMTETVTHIAVRKLNNFKNVIARETKQSQSNIPQNNSTKNVISSAVEKSYYKTLPNIKISTDERGCLMIKAPKISNEIVITNDVVELISETEFKWLGRFDSIINSGGIKLIPEQLEEKLAAIIKEQFFVAGLPDVVLGEKLVLVVEKLVTEWSRSAIISKKVNPYNNELFQKIKELKSLSKYEIPKEIFFVESFIKTPTEKINRSATLKLLEK
ncbi:AMP-binding protein [Lutibacter sp.]|uniref:AMP-binding protein n=1 Tax=Lutibacter sp. TaxID=1925666 RepID=UPI0034A01BD7